MHSVMSLMMILSSVVPSINAWSTLWAAGLQLLSVTLTTALCVCQVFQFFQSTLFATYLVCTSSLCLGRCDVRQCGKLC